MLKRFLVEPGRCTAASGWETKAAIVTLAFKDVVVIVWGWEGVYVKLWRDAKCALDAFPNELAAGKDALAGMENPKRVRGSFTVDLGEPRGQLRKGPGGGVQR